MTVVSPYPHISDPADFGRVAVLMGGNSAERDISLMTGQAVQDALLRGHVDAHPIDAADDLVGRLQRGGYARVWNALHGRGGEDGSLQGLLQHLEIPFTGSDVLGSAISMDKLRSKEIFLGRGLATPAYRLLESEADCDSTVSELGLPLMVKPVNEGSSLGLTKVEAKSDLLPAWQAAAKFDCEVIAEAWVDGPEYSAAIVHDQVLPLIRVAATGSFYDYEAKYFSDDTQYVCPCGLPAEQEKRFGQIALRAFNAVGASGWGRVDFMVNEHNEPQLLEVNTVPGMTSHSLVPMAAAEAGMSFDALVWRILETSFARSNSAAHSESGHHHGEARHADQA